MTFVDTNYFLRFLVKDNAGQCEMATELFEQAAKHKVHIFTSVVVFFEAYWVLTSFYKLDKAEVKRALKSMLEMSFLEIDNRECLVQSLENYEKSNLGLEDDFYLTYAKYKEATEFRTFDRKLEKMFKMS